MAMQNGAHILPAFAFGQTDMYSWIKPGPPLVPQRAVEALARMIGFLPLLIYGPLPSTWGLRTWRDARVHGPLPAAADQPSASIALERC